MIAAAVLLAGLAQAAPASGAVPAATQPRQATVERAVDFCEQVIAQPLTAVPDAWDAFMDTADAGPRMKPMAEAPEMVRTVAAQFATGDRTKALLRARTAGGDVWIGTTVQSPRCLVLAYSDQPGPESLADFALRFGGTHGGWRSFPPTAGSAGVRWGKPGKDANGSGSMLAGYPVGAKQIGFFLIMMGSPAPASAPRP